MADATDITAKIKVDSSDMRRGMREGANQARQFERQMTTAAGRIKRAWADMGFGRAASRLKALGSTIGGIAGVYGIAEGIRRVKDFEDALGDMTIQAGLSNDTMADTRKQILDTASKWGIMKDEVAGLAKTFVGFTGDLKGSLAMMDKMAMVSKATGASMSDLGAVTWQFQKNLDIKKVGEMVKAMAVLRGMEAVGPFTFKDFSQLGGRVFGRLGAFGKFGKGVRGLRAAGGLMEMAVPAVGGDKTMAATATATFMKQLFLKEKEIGKMIGAPVLGRDLVTVFRDIGRAMKDTKKRKALIRAFAEGAPIAQRLQMAAAPGQWQGMAGKFFGAKEADLAGQAAQRMDQPAEKWKKAMAKLDAAMHRFLLPVMQKLVAIMPKLAKSMMWVMDNAKLLLKAWVGFKTIGFFRQFASFLEVIKKPSAGGAASGLLGQSVATMNVRATHVSVMGGGVGAPGVGMPGTVPGGPGQQQRRQQQRRLVKPTTRAGRIGAGLKTGAAIGLQAVPVLGQILGGTIMASQLLDFFGKRGVAKGFDLNTDMLGMGTTTFSAGWASQAKKAVDWKTLRKGDWTERDTKKYDTAQNALQRQMFMSLPTYGASGVGSELSQYVGGIDYRKVRARGKGAVRKTLEEMKQRRAKAVQSIATQPGTKGASLKEIEELQPSVKQLSETIKLFQAAVNAFNAGKKFVIKVPSNAQGRSDARSGKKGKAA